MPAATLLGNTLHEANFTYPKSSSFFSHCPSLEKDPQQFLAQIARFLQQEGLDDAAQIAIVLQENLLTHE